MYFLGFHVFCSQNQHPAYYGNGSKKYARAKKRRSAREGRGAARARGGNTGPVQLYLSMVMAEKYAMAKTNTLGARGPRRGSRSGGKTAPESVPNYQGSARNNGADFTNICH